jgi:hypothetical protein
MLLKENPCLSWESYEGHKSKRLLTKSKYVWRVNTSIILDIFHRLQFWNTIFQKMALFPSSDVRKKWFLLSLGLPEEQ